MVDVSYQNCKLVPLLILPLKMLNNKKQKHATCVNSKTVFFKVLDEFANLLLHS